MADMAMDLQDDFLASSCTIGITTYTKMSQSGFELIADSPRWGLVAYDSNFPMEHVRIKGRL
jgi:hypothetical protein